METKQQSNFGEWVFLAGGLALAGGYLAHENIDTINAWLMTMQTATPTNGASMGAWLTANWGIVMLIAAIIIVGVKWVLSQRQGAVGSDGGPAVTYRRYKFVNVKLVR